MLLKVHENETQLNRIYLEFERIHYPQTTIQTAKSLLKTNSSDLLLFGDYAKLQISLGNSKDAIKLLRITLEKANQVEKEERPNANFLFRMWAELESKNPGQAVQILSGVPFGKFSQEKVQSKLSIAKSRTVIILEHPL